MTLFPSDYAILALAAAGAITGLFTGFSGALGMLAGTVGGTFAGRCCWGLSAAYLSASWQRALAVMVAAIVGFGIVRFLVKKFVRVLIAQPGDAIFGSLATAALGFSLSAAVVYGVNLSGLMVLDSSILREIQGLVG